MAQETQGGQGCGLQAHRAWAVVFRTKRKDDMKVAHIQCNHTGGLQLQLGDNCGRVKGGRR